MWVWKRRAEIAANISNSRRNWSRHTGVAYQRSKWLITWVPGNKRFNYHPECHEKGWPSGEQYYKHISQVLHSALLYTPWHENRKQTPEMDNCSIQPSRIGVMTSLSFRFREICRSIPSRNITAIHHNRLFLFYTASTQMLRSLLTPSYIVCSYVLYDTSVNTNL